MSAAPTTRLSPENAIETLRAVIAGHRDLDAAEIFVQERRSLSLESRNEDVGSVLDTELVELGLRTRQGKRVAHNSCSQLDLDSLKELVEKNIAMLPFVPEAHGVLLPPLQYEGDPTAAKFKDPTFEMIPLEEKMNRIINLEGNLRKVDTRIKRGRRVEYLETHLREWLWTLGSKRVLSSELSLGQLQATAVAEEGSENRAASAWDLQTHYYDLDWGAVARKASGLALKLLGSAPIATGSYPILFSSEVSPQVLGLLGASLSGQNCADGQSFLRDDLGKTVFATDLVISDDPGLKKRAGSAFWDAEGVTTQRLSLVQNGTLQAFAHDLRSAQLVSSKSTGNALRLSPAVPPSVGYHNLLLEPGKKDFVDLLRDMGRGMVIYQLLGLHTANPLTGEFSFGASGVWVENGEERHPVSGITIAGNLKELFRRVRGVGRDVRWDDHWGAPSILVEELAVSGQ